MRTSTVSEVVSRPSPWQEVHTLRTLPLPPQRGHVRLKRMARHLRDVARALAHPGKPCWRAPRSTSAAGSADFLAVDIQTDLRAANGLPEAHVQCVLEVGAALRLRGVLLASASEKLPEQIVKAAAKTGLAPASVLPPPVAVRPGGEVIRKNQSRQNPCWDSADTRPRLQDPRRKAGLGIEADLVVHLALLGVAEDVVSFLHLLEALLGGFVARIQIWMELTGETAPSFADLFRAGFPRHTQQFVIVLFRGHIVWRRTLLLQASASHPA
jgi:hypothetical protein